MFVCVFLVGCNAFSWFGGGLKEMFYGTKATFTSYDEDSKVIDRVKSDQMMVSAEDTFATVSSDGTTTSSSVLNLTIGKKSMIHIGSSALIAQDGLVDVFDEYAKTYDIENHDTRGIPFLNKMINDMKNLTFGQDYIILIRSQTGKPLATFVGKDVSYFSTEIAKTTGILIDGYRLLIYRCDYSIIPLSFIE